MKHSTGKPTKAEAARMARLKEMPCIACWMKEKSVPCGPTEVHHLIRANKRRGHAYTVPLGAWHHRGVGRGWVTEAIYGPSLARAPKAFREAFGDDEILLSATNQLLEKHHACGT